MYGPGEYVTDITEGITRVEDLPEPKNKKHSRNYNRRKCPFCGYLAYRDNTFTRKLHDIGDLKYAEHGLEMTVNGKTGPRAIPLVVCQPDLDNWLNDFHMFRSDPEAPLFPRFNKKQLELNLHVDGIANVVRKVVARARLIIESLRHKRVTPHSSRHARATELARLGWTEAMLRVHFGWTEDSTMPPVYIHLSQSDVARRYYRMYGKEEADKEAIPRLEENEPCPHCGIRNPTGYITCFSCHMPIDNASAELKENKKYTVDMLNKKTTRAAARVVYLSPWFRVKDSGH